MNYVKHFNIYGVDVKQVPCAIGLGAPTSRTAAAVGCFYMDVNSESKDIYKCIGATAGRYTWSKMGEGSVDPNVVRSIANEATRELVDSHEKTNPHLSEDDVKTVVNSYDFVSRESIESTITDLTQHIENLEEVADGKQDVLVWLTEDDIDAMFEGTYHSGEPTEPTLIDFSIETMACQAEEGMNWHEWANSEYNTSGIYVYEEETDNIRNVTYGVPVLYRYGDPVKGVDPIVPGFDYHLV